MKNNNTLSDAHRHSPPRRGGVARQPAGCRAGVVSSALFPLLLAFVTPCLAQETPAWQFFGGYSFQRADVREYFKTTPIIYTFRHHYVNMNGFEFSVTENRNRWFGGTLDFSGYYK